MRYKPTKPRLSPIAYFWFAAMSFCLSAGMFITLRDPETSYGFKQRNKITAPAAGAVGLICIGMGLNGLINRRTAEHDQDEE